MADGWRTDGTLSTLAEAAARLKEGDVACVIVARRGGNGIESMGATAIHPDFTIEIAFKMLAAALEDQAKFCAEKAEKAEKAKGERAKS